MPDADETPEKCGVGKDSAGAKKTLRIVSLALLGDMLLYGVVVPILPVYVSRLGASQAQVGLLFGSYALALLAATPWMGRLCGRVGSRPVLLAGLAGLSASTLLFAGADGYALLLIARSLQGIAAAAIWTAGLASLAAAFAQERRGRVLALMTTISALGTLLGPPLGGFIAEYWGQAAAFVMLALFAAAVGLAAWRDPAVAAAAQAPAQEAAGQGLLADVQVRQIGAVIVLGASLLGLLEPMLPLDLSARLGAGPGAIGLLFAVCTVAYGLSAPVFGYLTDRFGPMRVIACGWAAAAAVVPALALPQTLAGQALLMLALGPAIAAMLSPTLQALATAADRHGHEYGLVYAAYNFAFAAGLLAGSLVGGALVQAFGTPAALALTSAALAVLGIAPVAGLLRRERERLSMARGL